MSIEQYSRARQIELGQSLANRKRIYLDARFWIILRDAALGSRNDPAAQKLLDYLRRGVASGCLVCPISATMFLELMKQRYTESRRIGTARLIDELSLGVTMAAPKVVMGTEVYTFMLRAKGGVDLYSMQELIWTKVAYVLGDTYPSLPHLSPAQELEMQKAFFDHMWNCSLSDMVKVMGDISPPGDGFLELSQKINEKNIQHKVELRSFAQTYDIELRGGIELAGEMAADVLHDLAEKNAERELRPTQEERAGVVNQCCNLLYHALKKPEVKSILRGLHVEASIHAAMRWDKGRKFRPNDQYDFQHAVAALCYCDAFLTEGSLHSLVTRSDVDLEPLNGCRVFSDIRAAADYVGLLVDA